MTAASGPTSVFVLYTKLSPVQSTEFIGQSTEFVGQNIEHIVQACSSRTGRQGEREEEKEQRGVMVQKRDCIALESLIDIHVPYEYCIICKTMPNIE